MSRVARIRDGVAAFDAATWDALAGAGDPFVRHAFLTSLEASGSVGPGTGWQPLPIAVEDGGRMIAVAPAYAKSHSRGEYVFDHGWADAFERAGGAYYPKLQIAVPFTPVTGRRLLARDAVGAAAVIGAAEALVLQNGLSSAHATFVDPAEVPLFEAAGWMIRTDRQFHWHNQGFACFDDFLATLTSRKRKTIRRERTAALEGLEVEWLTGAALTPTHWDAFWTFYQDTGARKWGHPYLTRPFFDLLGARLSEQVLLVMASRDGRPIAGALNLIGGDALYGRYWGAREEVPFLHFELSYYQAIDFAIARRLSRVEAGAQGEHKLSRGYRPTPTFSAHFIADPRLREAVAAYLDAERPAVAEEIAALDALAPFRAG